MKNLKKSLAVLISVALIATLFVPVALAEDTYTYGQQAEDLNALGLYKGISESVFNPDLGTALDRKTGVTLLIRVGGLEEAALAMTEAEIAEVLGNFADADEIANWARPFAAKAVAEGLVIGITATTFGPDVELTGQQYVTMLLRFIGYEVTAENYDEAMEMLQDKGGLTEDMMEFGTRQVIKDDVVGITFQALSAETADGQTVIRMLIEAGAVEREVAEGLGLLGKVDTVEATNGKLTAVLTEAPDEAPELEDFTVTKAVDEGDAEEVTATGLDWTVDTATAELTVPTIASTGIDQSVVYTVSFKGTTAVAAEAIIIPGALEVIEESFETNYSLKQIKFAFTTAVDEDTLDIDSQNVMVRDLNGDEIDIDTITLLEDERTVYVTFEDAQDQNMGIIITIDGVAQKDDWNNKVENFNKTTTLSDNVSPVVENIELTSARSLEIEFSEPMSYAEKNSQATLSEVLVDNTGLAVESFVMATDNPNKWEAILLAQLDPGDRVVTVRNFEDYDGNSIPEISETFAVEEDTTLPEIEDVTMLTNERVRISFNKPIDMGESEVTIKGDDYDLDDDSKVTKINLATVEIDLDTALNVNDTYGTTISYSIEDLVGNSNTSTFEFVAPADQTPLEVVSVDVLADNVLTVTFTKAVNDATTGQGANNEENYVLYLDGEIEEAQADDVNQVSDRVFEVTFNALSDIEEVETYEIEISNIKDKSLLERELETVKIPFDARENVPPGIVGANAVVTDSATGGKHGTFRILFSKPMDETSMLNKTNYTIEEGGQKRNLNNISGSLIRATANNVVTITLPSKTLELSNANYTVTVSSQLRDTGGLALEDGAHDELQFVAQTDLDGGIIDDSDSGVVATGSREFEIPIANYLFETDPDAEDFKIGFWSVDDSQEASDEAAAAMVKLDATDDNGFVSYELPTVRSVRITNNGKKAVLGLNADLPSDLTVYPQYGTAFGDIQTTGSHVYSFYVYTESDSVEDALGNNIVFAETSPDAKQKIDDEIAPEVAEIEGGTGTITVSFTEDVQATSADLATANFMIKRGSTTVVPSAVDFLDASGDSGTIDHTGFRMIELTVPNTGTHRITVRDAFLTDSEGNAVVAKSETSVTVE